MTFWSQIVAKKVPCWRLNQGGSSLTGPRFPCTSSALPSGGPSARATRDLRWQALGHHGAWRGDMGFWGVWPPRQLGLGHLEWALRLT